MSNDECCMNRQFFTVTLEEEVIISRRAATLGGQGSLDYLTGAAFLGVSARVLYPVLSREDAYTVFHSGKVRFGNALLLSPQGQPVYPVPLCWHTDKDYGQDLKDGMVLRHKKIHNNRFEPKGRKSLGNGYITLDGCYYRPQTVLRMKTAINPQTGRANEGQLFGYAGLAAGLRFRFALSADEDIPKELFDRVTDSLTGTVRIGRSRSAEYGRVRVAVENSVESLSVSHEKNVVVLWLLSDMALTDDWGQPALTPEPAHFGLPRESNADNSFIRTRRYAPFNAYYRKREQERAVLCMGSVLTFNVPSGFDARALAKKLEHGVGLHREAGLGKIWVNPPLLADPQPAFEKRKDIVPEQPGAVSMPDSPLFHWLRAKNIFQENARQAEKIADIWVEELSRLYPSARLLASVPAGMRIGPSPSQWGRVMGLAKTAGISAAELKKKLFEGEDAVCKEKKDPDWLAEIFLDEGGPSTFRAWLQARCKSADPALLPAIAALTARRAADMARNEEEGGARHAG
ncbi:MAG: hypothetical protein GY862_38950 [Gammaproteobacteria bacterium]|nr:hypothetical protein [Gammaproteobacteria bacterium]